MKKQNHRKFCSLLRRPSFAHRSWLREGGSKASGYEGWILHSAFSEGFSLVEVSLALLIIGIGMLAILGMFPAGLDQNARSISDTHAALFAGEVFSAIRVHAETNWQDIGTDIVSLRVAGADNWSEPAGPTNWLDNTMRTNIYRHPDNPEIIDHAFRYRISLTTNSLIKAAFLRFWPGEFGTASNPAMFYAEFFKLNP